MTPLEMAQTAAEEVQRIAQSEALTIEERNRLITAAHAAMSAHALVSIADSLAEIARVAACVGVYDGDGFLRITADLGTVDVNVAQYDGDHRVR